MPFAWWSLVAPVLAMLLGFALGWWPLAAWAGRVMHGERMSRRTIRVTAAVVTAVVFGALTWRFGLTWTLPALLAFAACATVLSVVDLAEHRLPNAVVFPALAGVGALLLLASLANSAWLPMLWALAGAAAMFAVYLLLALISPSSMGMGDVKLALVIGLLLGWFGLSTWLLGLLGAFIVGGVIAIVALALRRVTLQGSIPFGPSMLAGALLALLVAGP